MTSRRRAQEVAKGLEAAEINTKSLQESRQAQGMYRVEQEVPSESCFRCGRKNHSSKSCIFKDSKCHACGKTGHIATVCKSKPLLSTLARQKPKDTRKSVHRTKYIKSSPQINDENSIEESQEFLLLSITGENNPIKVDLCIEGILVQMELDIGAAVTLMSEASCKYLLPALKLKTSKVKLKTYTSESLQVIGETTVDVTYGNQQCCLDLLVVRGEGPSLLGRNWLKHLQLDWSMVANVRDNLHQCFQVC